MYEISVGSGHRRPGALPHHHDGVLSRRHGLHPDVRRHQRGIVQQCSRLVSTGHQLCTLRRADDGFVFRCTQIKTYSWDNAQVILVGNKCDMEDERVISFERGKQLADSLGLEFFETSAKENINVRVSHPASNSIIILFT